MLVSLLQAALGFITLPLYTNYLSPADYGILALFILFGTLVIGIISMGLKTATYRYYFNYGLNNDYKFKSLNFTNIFTLSIIYLILIIPIIFISPWISNYIFSNRLSPNIINLSFISAAINYLCLYLNELLIAKEKSTSYFYINTTRIIINHCISLYLIIGCSLSYMGKIYGILFVDITLLITLLVYLRNNFSIKYSVKFLKRSLKFSYPLTFRKILGSINNSLSKLFLNNFSGLSTVGQYSVGVQFATFVGLVQGAISKGFNPFFFKNFEKNNSINESRITHVYQIISGLIVGCGIFIIMIAEELVKFLTSPEFYPSMYVIPIYSYFHMFSAIGLCGSPQLMHSKKMIYFLPSSFSNILINVFLNILLIPILGAVGAAITSACAALGSNLLLLFFGQRFCRVNINYSYLFVIYTISFICTSISYYFMFLDISLFIKLPIKISIFLLYLYFILNRNGYTLKGSMYKLKTLYS